MDRRGSKLLGLFVASIIGISAASAAGTDQPLNAMAWLAENGQFEALSSQPATTFRMDATMLAQSDRILAGEQIFSTPSLLGGQAAKAGISCASCHVNGQGNPHFHFPGVSGDPGTADVTHSFFSSHRGDDNFNPVPIPDLTRTGKISRQIPGELETFIRGLIVEEFDGQEPGEEILDLLSLYVRALEKPDTISANEKRSPVNLNHYLSRIDIAIRQAKSFASDGKGKIAKLQIAAARHYLGQIHERYTGRRLSGHREKLVRAGKSLGDIQDLIATRIEGASSALLRWDELFHTTKKLLVRDEEHSLFDPEMLKMRLNGATSKD